VPASAAERFCDANDDETSSFVTRFATYQPRAVTRAGVIRWLGQFTEADYPLAFRLLNAIDFYDLARVQALMRELHRAVTDLANGHSCRRIMFLPLGRPGDSGQVMMANYRNVNRLDRSRITERVDLPKLVFEAAKQKQRLALVFLDDFVGSGRQVCNYWNEMLSQLVGPGPLTILAAPVVTHDGANRIQNNTPIAVVGAHYVPPAAVLSATDRFSDGEKNKLKSYCQRAGNMPLGFFDMGLLLAFTHGAPNNTLAAIRGSKRQTPWFGILPRYEDLP
jgi:hypothetical protein